MSPTPVSARPRGLCRAFAVIGALWRANVAEELQYRANFLTSILGTLFSLALALLTIALFFRQTTNLGGWDFWEVAVLLGVFNALAGLVEAILRPGVGRLVGDVRSGALDLILARPVEPQVYVSFRRIDIWRFADVVLGLGLSAFALAHTGRFPGPVPILAFLLTLASAAAIIYALWIALMTLTFWFVAVENLAVLFDAVYEAARYPVSAYPGALRFLFVYLIPIAWTTTIPAEALTGRLGPGAAAIAVGVAVVALGLTRALWRTAIRRYTSAGG